MFGFGLLPDLGTTLRAMAQQDSQAPANAQQQPSPEATPMSMQDIGSALGKIGIHLPGMGATPGTGAYSAPQLPQALPSLDQTYLGPGFGSTAAGATGAGAAGGASGLASFLTSILGAF